MLDRLPQDVLVVALSRVPFASHGAVDATSRRVREARRRLRPSGRGAGSPNLGWWLRSAGCAMTMMKSHASSGDRLRCGTAPRFVWRAYRMFGRT